MSLFDKIFGKPASGQPTDGDLPDWITEADADLEECDRLTPAGAKGISKERVDEIVMPMLRGKENQLARRYGTMLISPIRLSRTGPNGEAGVLWCTRCQHGSMFIGFAREGQVEKCSSCQTSGPVGYLVYAPDVGRRIRELFVAQVRAIRLVERAETLLQAENNDEAISALTTAATICQQAGNRTGVADVQCSLGKAYSKIGNWSSALSAYDEAIDWFGEANDFLGLAKAEHGLASAAFDAGVHGLAETHFLHGLDATHQGDETGEDLAKRASILNGLALATLTHWDDGRTAIAYAEKADLAYLEVGRVLAEQGVRSASTSKTNFGATLRKFASQFPNSPDEEFRRAVDADARNEPAVAAEHVRAARKALEATGDAEPLLNILNKQLLFLFKDSALLEAAEGCEQAETLARRLGRDDALSAALQNGAGLIDVLVQMEVEGYAGRGADAARKKEEGEALGKLVEQRKGDEPRLRAEATEKASADVAGAVSGFTLLAESLQSRGATREQGDVMAAIAALQHQLGDASRSLKSAVDAESMGRRSRSRWLVSTSLLLQGDAMSSLGRSEGAAFRIVRAAEELAAILMEGPKDPPDSPFERSFVVEMLDGSIEAVIEAADESNKLARPRQAARLRERLADIWRESTEVVVPESALVERFAANLLALADLARTADVATDRPAKMYLDEALNLIEAHRGATGELSERLTEIHARVRSSLNSSH